MLSDAIKSICLQVWTKRDNRQVYITLPKYGCVGRLGVALRLIVAIAIFCYIVVQHIILEGGYSHPLEGGQSYIFPKLRGFFLTNFTRDQLDEIPQTILIISHDCFFVQFQFFSALFLLHQSWISSVGGWALEL